MPRHAVGGYSAAQIVLHWTIAALVLLQFLFAERIEELWEARLSGAVPDAPSPTLHTVAGMAILALMIARLALRLRRGAPAPPLGETSALARLAAATHVAFYVLLIAMPVGGAVAWFGGVEAAAEIHGIAASVLLALVLLHVAAALAHRFWFRDGVFQRMLRPAP